jgi:clan AA aspartic protease
MGLVYANIKLSNPALPNSMSLETDCLVDSGSTYLCITQHMANQLIVNELYQKEAQLADGTSRLLPYVGPIKVEFENRVCFTGAMVLGDECLLGAITMEDMDLVIHPRLFKLSVNPESPNIARGKIK